MSDIINNAIAVALSIAAANTPESIAAIRAVKADERTKEQKLVLIADDLAKTATRFDNVANDRVVAKPGKVVYQPEVGDKVLATVGRNTATSQAKVVEGTVLAVRNPAEGEKGATQVRVRIYEGTFDEQTVTLYPAQLVKQTEGEAVAA